jgi:hypothetical protein
MTAARVGFVVGDVSGGHSAPPVDGICVVSRPRLGRERCDPCYCKQSATTPVPLIAAILRVPGASAIESCIDGFDLGGQLPKQWRFLPCYKRRAAQPRENGTPAATSGNQPSVVDSSTTTACQRHPATNGRAGPPREKSRLFRAAQERTMRIRQQLVWAATVAAAGLVAACNGAPNPATGPSALSSIESPASTALTADQAAALVAECGFGSGQVVLAPGAPPAGSPAPPDKAPTSGSSPGGPAGPPAPGAYVALGGVLEGRGGECPAITFTIGGQRIRTGDTTSFGSGACASLENGDLVGAMGTVQGDGAVVATCVAAGS